MKGTFIELEIVQIYTHGHEEQLPGHRWWRPETRWVTEPPTVEITGKLLVSLNDIDSVKLEELAAWVTTVERTTIEHISIESYNKLREFLVQR